ncbi:CTP synthase [Candidatus Saccharibacteria bacterium]|nr:CTP synthase [Candidatus Saccharibacteria bacterium]
MNTSPTRYLFVTGGVLSGVGKGITASSIGAVLKARGLKVTMQKCDPYLNVDAGTLNPAEHGECFVTRDGAETDLDLGHYERFLNEDMTRRSITLSGFVLRNLIQDERNGKFLGKTVQLVPHFTNALQEAIVAAGEGSDVHIVEIGGTAGDIEGAPFLEAIRELAAKVGRDHCQFVNVVYVPYLSASKEFKTKPAQNAMRDLRQYGIIPDVIVARTERPVTDGIVRKLSMFGGVRENAVIVLSNADTVYRVPLTIREKGVDDLLLSNFHIEAPEADMSAWEDAVKKATTQYDDKVRIGVVAKYLDNEDTYISVLEALKAAAWNESTSLEYEWVSAEAFETHGQELIDKYDGLLVPGGFGSRGTEGKIAAASYALEAGVPYLGICLGMQVAVIAAVRRGGETRATSEEFTPGTEHNAIYIMEDQKGKEATGGTMRLGDYPCEIAEGSLAERVYGSRHIVERHRHRYEVNRAFEQLMNEGGLRVSGASADGRLVEMVEAVDHPYFIATQAHPEFKSRPTVPHPLFTGLIRAAKAAAKT